MLFQHDKLYTMSQISEIFGGAVGPWVIRQAIHRGEIPAIRAGARKILIKGSDAAKLITPVEVGNHAKA